jgi:predicted ATPase
MKTDRNRGPLVQEITPRNFLSYGPQTHAIGLQRLNVLIGPNGSGKSNLIDALCLLRAAPMDAPPRDMQSVISRGGGVREWIWKGAPDHPACLSIVLTHPDTNKQPLRHAIEFRAEEQVFRLTDEKIEHETPRGTQQRPYFFYHFDAGRPVVNVKHEKRKLQKESIEPNVSIVAQRRDPEQYPEISYIGDQYRRIRIYREWAFGRNTIFREPQRADLRTDLLEEDFSNLGLYLNRLRRDPPTKKIILTYLRDIYEGVDDFDVSIEAGTVQVFFTEGRFTVPATRLSDGTLRFLCLLAILCDPSPPPLVCIEEPELGLHPDILPKIADLLLRASEVTQLIVTTHSDILVDALSDTPEAVLVCEKRDSVTTLVRLEGDNIRPWLDRYRLGGLWLKGEIGGVRW